GEYMTDVASGTVNIAMTNMFASGAKSTFKVADGAKVNVFNGRFNNMNRTLADNSVAPRVSVHSSIINFVGGSIPAEMDWKHNLTPTWEFDNISGLLPRNGWVASASVNSGSAQLAIDGVSSTRWAAGAQQPGQWFAVNFNKPLSFNAIIMDSTPSGNNDGPAAYKVEVYKDGAWIEVASGTNGSANCIVLFEPQNSNQVRVTQTGKKTNYWSVHEFYVANLDFSDLDETIVAENNPALRIADGCIVTPADCMVEVYTLTGQMVALLPTDGSRADISALAPGIYIAVARTDNGPAVLKFKK
ncbi:MAG: discoidin domain-containing protein, partial [Duncaniella sp.]|nr:discoidin domain-containing protein [Duncaniella sp.]